MKEISQKVASLSNDIKMETFQSGETLSAIENNVLTVKDNTAKAQKDSVFSNGTNRKRAGAFQSEKDFSGFCP